MGYRGLGELEFPQKTYVDASYMKVYELANRYKWVVLFHTGIVLRAKFTEPENVASYRMSSQFIEEIARRFPQITVIGAHCGNPDYQWSAEIARVESECVFRSERVDVDEAGHSPDEFSKFFWWSKTRRSDRNAGKNPSAFTKIVFGRIRVRRGRSMCWGSTTRCSMRMACRSRRGGWCWVGRCRRFWVAVVR